MPSRHSTQQVTVAKNTLQFFRDRGHQPRYERLDNECSPALKYFLKDQGMEVQLVPPHNHRANRAERVVRDISLPLDQFDESLPQLEIVLNSLRPFDTNPQILAYEGIHKHPYDFMAHPMARFGTKVLIHEAPAIRGSWSPHGVPVFYLGPAMDHYLCI